MMVHEGIGVDTLDWRFGQVAPVAPVLPPAAPVGTQTIPVVLIGPTRIMDKSGENVPGIRATLRTPARFIRTVEVPGGIFQAVVDQSDFGQGIAITFGAPDRPPITVQANALYCSAGTRNEHGTITSPPGAACAPQSYYFDPSQQVERPAYRREEPPPQAPARGRRSRPRRPRAEVEQKPVAAPAAPAAAPAAVAPAGAFLTTQQDTGTSPWLYVGIGGGALAIIGLIFLMK
jgi:hypothetical protein